MDSSNCQQSPNSVALTVSDMKNSIAFYCDRLGFTMKECWPDKNAPLWASLSLDGQTMMLGQAMPEAQCQTMHADNPAAGKYWSEFQRRFRTSPRGVGAMFYFMVPNVDDYAAAVVKKSIKLDLQPTSQFYGLRDCVVTDPDGFTLVFYSLIKMESCQSCGMPMPDAAAGMMYCQYCSDKDGHLHPYEQILEGTINGYFVEMLKMPREQAVVAAKEHLAKMPAWASRK